MDDNEHQNNFNDKNNNYELFFILNKGRGGNKNFWIKEHYSALIINEINKDFISGTQYFFQRKRDCIY